MNKTAELERRLDDVRMSLEFELAQPERGREAPADQIPASCDCTQDDPYCEHDAGRPAAAFGPPRAAQFHAGAYTPGHAGSPGWRTEELVSKGRHSSYHLRLSRGRKVAIAVAVVVAVLVAIVVMTLPGGRASWPASVPRMQSEASRACQNPDVRSEPGQINFACARATRQILWVFALLTSGGNPDFADARTGRIGLEPITPAQGGEVAWSLNLHHPYHPANPIDSIEVAARAINNIIGGATVTGANGNPVVQPGLESDPANCVRYTGSAALSSRRGFPSLCARPVTSPAGQAALVADVFQKWVVGAAPATAQDAAVLFENSANVSDPRVQAILDNLQHSKPQA
ncbi:MAG TPA: hypothetical protein DHU96_09365 [Actinobacteria bacterium]|nr:hypothetical protein [Actinomycetota bacterium]